MDFNRWHRLCDRLLKEPGPLQGRFNRTKLRSLSVEELVRMGRTHEIRARLEEIKLVEVEEILVKKGNPFVRRPPEPPPPTIPPAEKLPPRKKARPPKPKPKRTPPPLPWSCKCGCGDPVKNGVRKTQLYLLGHFRRVKPLATKSDRLS